MYRIKMVLPWSGRSVNYTHDDMVAVMDAMNADPQTQGKHQEAFEQAFSDYHHQRHAFAVSSGAAALEIAAMLAKINPGDEVIMPAHTYCATAIPFARRGAKIVWADIHPDYRMVCAETIKPLITENTKAVVAVHLYGCNAPMSCIVDLCRHNDLLIIEDCAQSLGAVYGYPRYFHGPSAIGTGPSGTHGDIACYSFHAQKNITTLGEGGMITVKDNDLAKLIPGLRHNGHRGYPNNREVSFDIPDVYPYNFSIGEVQCAVGLSQFKRLDALNADRYNKAREIVDGLSDIKELEFQKIPKGSTHTYHLLCAKFPERDKLMDVLLHKFGIECKVQYAPLYTYPLFKDHREHDCPNTDDFYAHMLSFPYYEWYGFDKIQYLIESIRKGIALI